MNSTSIARKLSSVGKQRSLLRVDGLPPQVNPGKVLAFHGGTALSALFEFQVEIELSAAPSYDSDQVLETLQSSEISVEITLDGSAGTERWFHGRVVNAQISETGGKKARSHLALQLRPALWWLSLDWDTRLFTDKSAREIIDEVLGTCKPTIIFEWRLAPGRSFMKRPICRQYRESNLHFLHRLLEDEGLHYWFEFAKGSHRVILGDDPARLPACPRPQPIQLDSKDGQQAARKRKDRIYFLQRDVSVQSAKYVVQARDAADPFACLEGSNKLSSSTGGGTIFDPIAEAASLDECKKSAMRGLRSLGGLRSTLRGSGDVRDFCAGQTIVIAGEGTSSPRRCRLTSVQFEAVQHETLRYRNHFTAVPLTAPFAPERKHGKPVIAGLELAEVLSAPDRRGRVKVRFDLDRSAGSSAWVPLDREHDTWWAARPGQRVLVAHLEGDPDRPVIDRSIDQDATLPFDPATHPKRGGITTPFHRIWFDDDDKLRRLLIEVGGELVEQVLGNRSEQTEGDAQSTIGGSALAKIGKELGINVGDNLHAQIAGSLLANIGKALGFSVGEELILSAGKRIVFVVNNNCVIIDETGVTIIGKKVRINPPGMQAPSRPAASRSPEPAKVKVPARRPRKDRKKQ